MIQTFLGVKDRRQLLAHQGSVVAGAGEGRRPTRHGVAARHFIKAKISLSILSLISSKVNHQFNLKRETVFDGDGKSRNATRNSSRDRMSLRAMLCRRPK